MDPVIDTGGRASERQGSLCVGSYGLSLILCKLTDTTIRSNLADLVLTVASGESRTMTRPRTPLGCYPLTPAAAAAAAIERAVQFAGNGERDDLSVSLNSERVNTERA